MSLHLDFSSWPSKKIDCDVYLNRGNRSIFLALKPETPLVFAVDQLVYILQKEKAKTIIKVGFDKEQIITALKESEIQDRVCLFKNIIV